MESLHNTFEAERLESGIVISSIVLALFIAFFATHWQDLKWRLRAPNYPTINPGGFLSKRKAINAFIQNCCSLLQDGRQRFGGPFYMNSDLGKLLILPPDYTQAVSREKNLKFTEFIGENFFAPLETFDVFRSSPVLFTSISRLTQRLPTFVRPMSAEVSFFLAEKWGDGDSWTRRPCLEDIVELVARVSARTFIGEVAARNPEWIRIAIGHSARLQYAAEQLRLWPAPLRWLAERFAPLYRGARAERRRAAEILAPIMAAEHAELKAAAAEERKPNLPENMFDFARKTAKNEKYSEVTLQLSVAFSATQTTADILAQAVVFLAQRPQDQQALRDEAVSVIQKHGWHKHALTEAHLLDSFIKETQRLKPTFMAGMQRLATDDVVLPDGLKLPKGTKLAIPAWDMWDSANYDEPERFDAARFAKLRQLSGFEYSSQLVSTSQAHTGFGHGLHACPGRFFASNAIKVCMMHILMKYDLELDGESQAEWKEHGSTMITSQAAQLRMRRRKSEIDLDAM